MNWEITDKEIHTNCWFLIRSIILDSKKERDYIDFVYAQNFEDAKLKFKQQFALPYVFIESVRPELMFTPEEIRIFNTRKEEGNIAEDSKLEKLQNYILEKLFLLS